MASPQYEIARQHVGQRMSLPGDDGNSDIVNKFYDAIKNLPMGKRD